MEIAEGGEEDRPDRCDGDREAATEEDCGDRPYSACDKAGAEVADVFVFDGTDGILRITNGVYADLRDTTGAARP